MPVAGWKVHRLIGMSGGLITKAAGHEIGRELSEDEVGAAAETPRRGLQVADAGSLCVARRPRSAPPPPRREDQTRHRHVRKAPGRAAVARRAGAAGATWSSSIAPRSSGPSPNPTCFSPARNSSASPRPNATSSATRCGICWPRGGPAMLGIGVLSGGYGEQELAQAGAYRVYSDPAAAARLYLPARAARRVGGRSQRAAAFAHRARPASGTPPACRRTRSGRCARSGWAARTDGRRARSPSGIRA